MADRLPISSLTVVPLGFDPPNSLSSDLELDTARLVVAFAGRLIHEKGVDVAIKAVGAARGSGIDVRLQIIGDGPARAALEHAVDQAALGTAVTFIGELEPKAALTTMKLADAIIVPSRWSEPAGYVVLEAMALGVPVIAADAGGLPEVGRGAILLCARDDVDAFAQAIMRLAADPTLRAGKRADGLRAAHDRTGDAMARGYRELYQQARERSAASRSLRRDRR